MTKAMQRKTSLEKKNLRNCDYFVIIPSAHSTVFAKYTSTRMQGAPLILITRIKDFFVFSRCRQNHKCGNFTSSS